MNNFSPKKKKEEKWEGDDDCEICKLMEKGEHNYGDLAEAFAKQNRKNEQNKENQGNKKS